jgi:hypothetical protein
MLEVTEAEEMPFSGVDGLLGLSPSVKESSFNFTNHLEP